MAVYKIFIASSMSQAHRQNITKTIDEVNEILRPTFKYELVAYGEEPIVDYREDTQKDLNHQAACSDFLIVLSSTDKPIGKYTFGEYKACHEQSNNTTNKRPYIKVFATYKQETDLKKVSYIAKDGSQQDFEKKLYSDSGRYVQFLLESKFLSFLKGWLIKVAYSRNDSILQGELSYKRHLNNIGQYGVRQYDNKYYRREELDGKIERILKTSPIIILEGNTYSGKTRAAFEFMKNCKAWEGYDFYIYDNRFKAEELSNIKDLDYSGGDRGNVFFFDDINSYFDQNKINYKDSIWAKLRGYNMNQGFTFDDFGKPRIIFTVSGKLSEQDKMILYYGIFHITEVNAAFESAIKRIIVNFDIYNKQSFLNMAHAMVREGVLSRSCIRPGNYTIGSLFYDTENIKLKTKTQYTENEALILTLVGHFKYASAIWFTGNIEEIRNLYKFINNKKEGKELFIDCIERLRSEGLIVTIREENKIFIDKYILEIFNNYINNKYNDPNIQKASYKYYKGSNALNCLLIDYAKECQNNCSEQTDLTNKPICYITQMAYLLIDRNTLEYNEVRDLIEIVASTLLSNTRQHEIKNVDIIIKLVKIIIENPERHALSFASSAIVHSGSFNYIKTLLENFKKYYNKPECPDKDKAITLYKESVYAMLSCENRTLCITEEKQVLSLILDSNRNWKEPFNKDDLKQVFHLSRFTTHIDMSAQEIIKLLLAVKPDDFLPTNSADDITNQDDYEEFEDDNFETGSQLMSDEKNGQSSIYEKVFLKQLNKVAIKSIYHINSLDDLKNTIESLQKACTQSEHVKAALERYFSNNFYTIAPKIINKINYQDRGSFFNLILGIDDTKGLIENVPINNEYIENLRTSHIHSLNALLEHLDENDALQGYQAMVTKNLCDEFTLSCLLKNKDLNFEQALRLFNENSNKDQFNFITLNQLMEKAETLSDANSCMHLMGIKDCDPCKIRDENAFASYLKINQIDSHNCIRIIQGRRQLYQDRFSEKLINVILRKLNIAHLIDIFIPSDKNKASDYYFKKYGFFNEEVQGMRKNAILLNILFYKANIGNNEISKRLKEKFEEIINDKELHFLITDPDYNGNNSIISVYMKNKNLFSDYRSVRKFYNNLPKGCTPTKVDHNIYSVFMWYIINDYRHKKYNRIEAIKSLNNELKEAYEKFAGLYSKNEVVNIMAKLYSYRPQLTNENSFDQKEEYIYEDKMLEISYKDYLDYLIQNNPAYVDSSFLYHSLSKMQTRVDNDVYNKLSALASINHIGVKYDTIFKCDKEKDTPFLSPVIQQKLFHIDNSSDLVKTDTELVKFDTNLVSNVSYIKVLWFLLNNEKILDKNYLTLERIENFRKEKNIPITETYLNIVLKHIKDNTLIKYKKSDNNNHTLKEGYEQMINYIKEMLTGENSYIHRNIQMCLSLIAVAWDEYSLNQIFQEHGFIEFQNRAEVIASRMNKILKLRYKKCDASECISEFRRMILTNCLNVNIWVINIYLSIFVRVYKGELFSNNKNELGLAPFQRCWKYLNQECKIDLFELLNLEHDEKEDIKKQMELKEDRWIMDANVQTFSYFAIYSAKTVSRMHELFSGNFTYDNAGKKNCLKDTLKNYAYSYDKFKSEQQESVLIQELNLIKDILLQEKNYKVFMDICDEYILTSSYKIESIQFNTINTFWKDMLSYPMFQNALLQYICEQRINKKFCKYNKLVSLNPEDSKRIDLLRNIFRIYPFEDELQKKIKDYFNECIEKNKLNAELFRIIVSLDEENT